MKFCTHIHGPPGVNSIDFDNLLAPYLFSSLSLDLTLLRQLISLIFVISCLLIHSATSRLAFLVWIETSLQQLLDVEFGKDIHGF